MTEQTEASLASEPSPPATTPVPRALLIDIDNCPKHMDHLPKNLDGFARIVVCYGGQEPKVHLGLVPLLAEAIQDGRLEIVGMEKKGKNAADFGLTFWAGRLLAEMPEETEFLVVSGDKDLDHMVNLLRNAKRKARRLDSKGTTTTQTKSSPPSPSPAAAAARDYVQFLLEKPHTRPGKRATLANSIKSHFGFDKVTEADPIIRAMIKLELVNIASNGKVTYPELQANGYDDDFDDDIPF